MSSKQSINDLKPKRRIPKSAPKPAARVVTDDLVAPPPLKAVKSVGGDRYTRPLVIIFMVIALVMVFVLAWIMYTNIKA